MSTKTIGLIGGMSWQSTSLYYTLINQHINARLGGVHSANILLRSLDYADMARYTATRDFDGMTAMLVSYARDLKAGGADAVALCANLAHKAADAIERDVQGLPVLHIADFTAREIVNSKGTKLMKVGLLGTRAVMEEEFYKARLRDRYGLDVFIPRDEDFRNSVDGLIFGELTKPEIADGVKDRFRAAYRELVQEQKVDCVVLACTEFRLVFNDEDFSVPTFETTALHAKGIAEWALQER